LSTNFVCRKRSSIISSWPPPLDIRQHRVAIQIPSVQRCWFCPQCHRFPASQLGAASSAACVSHQKTQFISANKFNPLDVAILRSIYGNTALLSNGHPQTSVQRFWFCPRCHRFPASPLEPLPRSLVFFSKKHICFPQTISIL
jgi:hypothetical protein